MNKPSQKTARQSPLAEIAVLEGESLDRFDELLASLQADLKPNGGVESCLVESMAVARWRQLNLWGMEKSGATPRTLDRFVRYEACYSREYHRSLKALLDLRAKQVFTKRSQSSFDPYVD